MLELDYLAETGGKREKPSRGRRQRKPRAPQDWTFAEELDSLLRQFEEKEKEKKDPGGDD